MHLPRRTLCLTSEMKKTRTVTKITHITSAHHRFDIRIFIKMCSSLSNNGYQVTLIVADGLGDECNNGVQIVDVGTNSTGRLSRITKTIRRVSKKTLGLDADIYHLHDPELMPLGVKLKKMGKTVVFDAHEDFPKQLLSKPYLHKPTRYLLSKISEVYEKRCCARFDAIVGATPAISEKFLKINKNTININNYPILGELDLTNNVNTKDKQVCYVGGISKIRGIEQMVDAMEMVQSGAKLQLVGSFRNKSLRNRVSGLAGWSNVIEQGVLDRNDVAKLLSSSMAGLVLFLPEPNHVESQPNKMFEYMSASIPVIASNFSLWRSVIEKNSCGICVDPMAPHEIAEAIDFLTWNPEDAKQMGKNGQVAIKRIYNWCIEEKKLLGLYENLIAKE